jgi:hypothetical protein
MQAGTLPDGQPDAGNCVGSFWAFFACAAFESSLLLQDIVSDPARLLLCKEIPIMEQGYHLVDLSRRVPLKEGDEFVIALGFAARDDATAIDEPLVYVAADTPQANKTFRSPFDPADGRDIWEDYASLHNGSAFYVQGFMAA